MPKLPLLVALVLALAACSESDRPRGPDSGSDWDSYTLADGAVRFSMPSDPQRRTTESGEGDERITEEIAALEYYEESLGLCHLRISVVSGPQLPADLGTTARERRNWAKLLIAGMVSEREGHKILEEGEWTFGDASGYRIRIALPPNPPDLTFPVFNWIRAVAVGDRGVILQFVGSQAAFENSLLKPKQDELRDRFFSSLTAN